MMGGLTDRAFIVAFELETCAATCGIGWLFARSYGYLQLGRDSHLYGLGLQCICHAKPSYKRAFSASESSICLDILDALTCWSHPLSFSSRRTCLEFLLMTSI